MTIEDKLIDMRRAAGFTQQEIADLLGVERSTYAGYETGKAVIPIRKLQLLAIIYNVSLNSFNTNKALVLQAPDPIRDARMKQNDDAGFINNDERMTLAQIRIIRAMGKSEQLEEALSKLMENDDSKS